MKEMRRKAMGGSKDTAALAVPWKGATRLPWKPHVTKKGLAFVRDCLAMSKNTFEGGTTGPQVTKFTDATNYAICETKHCKANLPPPNSSMPVEDKGIKMMVYHKDSTVIVAFRGTSSIDNCFADLEEWKVRLPTQHARTHARAHI